MSTINIKFISKFDEQRPNSYEQLLTNIYSDRLKIQSVQIITGYWDEKSINQVISWIKNHADKTTKTHFSLYLNRITNTKHEDTLKKLHKKIRKNFTDPWSGIYIFTQAFVHIKGFKIEGRAKQVITIGSNNLTQAALQNNEEAYIKWDYSGLNSKKLASKFDKYIQYYFNDTLEGESRQCVAISNYNFTPNRNSLIKYIMDGDLWWEQKATDPYQFQLRLPQELRDKASANIIDVPQILEAEVKDSLNTKRLLGLLDRRNESSGQDNSQVEANFKVVWKKFVIETSFGFWAPKLYRDNILGELEKYEGRIKRHENYRDLIVEHEKELEQDFLEIIREIMILIATENISVGDSTDWLPQSKGDLESSVSFCDSGSAAIWKQRWNTHIEKLKAKLLDEQHLLRICRYWSYVDVPNILEDALAVNELVESFVFSFEYYGSQKWASKELCKKKLHNGKLNEERKLVCKLIENWKKENAN